MSAAREQALGRTVLREAELLEIPWQTILANEIAAERTLQRGLAATPAEWPLECAFFLLPNSLLHSWRVRDRVLRLAWEACAEHSREAATQLRALYQHFVGRRSPRAPVDFLMANHLWLGYRRVVELRAVTQAANRSRGTRGERVAAVVARTHCDPSDAVWAVERAGGRRSHDLDDAMRRARDEGFELPHARSEPEAFLRLRQFLRRRGFLSAKRGRRPLWATSFPEQERKTDSALPGDAAPPAGSPREAAAVTAPPLPSAANTTLSRVARRTRNQLIETGQRIDTGR